MDHRIRNIIVDDTLVKIIIYDTGGPLRFHSLAPMYYKQSQAAIVVYDITKVDTFSRAKTWIQELQSNASPGMVIALVGNKKDLADRREIEYEVRRNYIFCFYGERVSSHELQCT